MACVPGHAATPLKTNNDITSLSVLISV